jgi:hypothetical protein
MEKQIILAAFRHYRGNKTATANSLKIAIRTLDNKLEKYQQDDREEKAGQDARRIEREEFIKAQRGQPSEWRPKPVRDIGDGSGSEKTSKENGKAISSDFHKAANGVSMEPTSQTTTKSTMPLHVGKEVQALSLKNNAAASKRKGR